MARRRRSVIEADPVRVVEDADVLERGAHRGRVIEREPRHLDGARERVGTVRVTGQVPHALAAADEELRDVHAAVSEGSGDRVDRAVHDVLPWYSAFRIL
jgi:hypothetical protein